MDILTQGGYGVVIEKRRHHFGRCTDNERIVLYLAGRIEELEKQVAAMQVSTSKPAPAKAASTSKPKTVKKTSKKK